LSRVVARDSHRKREAQENSQQPEDGALDDGNVTPTSFVIREKHSASQAVAYCRNNEENSDDDDAKDPCAADRVGRQELHGRLKMHPRGQRSKAVRGSSSILVAVTRRDPDSDPRHVVAANFAFRPELRLRDPSPSR
jgi:hypothetical protein